MGKKSGCVLILAGLAVGGYAVYPEIHRVAAQIAAASGPAGGAAILKVTGAPTHTTGKPVGADAIADPQPAPKPAPEPSSGDPGESKKIVPPAPRVAPPTVPAKRPRTAVAAVKVSETPPRVPVGEAKTAEPPPEGPALTREIQLQLKRVGCYRGDVTGVWTPAVRQAMRDFTERANASLPVEGPDPVLLAMLQSHTPGTCSDTCPQGQDRAAGGRCVPSVLAGVKGGAGGKAAVKTRTAKSSGDGVSKDRRPAGETVAGSSLPPETSATVTDGRMSLAGPPPVSGRAQAKRRQAGPRRQARTAGSSRSGQGRSRRAYRQPSYGYSGLPSWALPFFIQ